MNGAHTLDVSGLADYEISSEAPLWWGQVLLCAIEGSMFGMVIAIYFYLRLSVDAWPTPGTKALGVAIPSIALIPLLLSCLASYWASEAAKRDDRRAMVKALILNLALAGVFMILRGIEWQTFTFNWRAGAYGAIVWSILFLHTFDSMADLLFTLVLAVIVARGRYAAAQRLAVHVDSVVWYFLVAIWIPLYIIVYWGPLLVGTRGG